MSVFRPSPVGRPLRKFGLAIALVMVVAGSGACARSAKGSDSISLAELSAEALATHALIHAGGPFPYPKDGSVFGNRERLLPGERRGYYREYTVQTPGARDRGPRRIVCGGQQVRVPESCYYTEDHYSSFRRIVR